MTVVLSSFACVIVHFGVVEVTAACVESLTRGGRRPWIIVVCNTSDAEAQSLCTALCKDNPTLDVDLRMACGIAPASVTNTTSEVADEYMEWARDVQLLSLSANHGFAVACNAGLRLARSNPSIRFAWLLNNDTTVAADATECLLHCLERQPRALLGTSVFRADDPERLELALGCGFSPLTTMISPRHERALPQAVRGTPKVDYIYGASLAFPLTLTAEIGFLDEDFFFYYEEHDYCQRAQKAGYALHWCRESVVWHGIAIKGAASSPAPTISARAWALREFKHFHETRSTVLFMCKHHKVLAFPALLFRTLAKGYLLWARDELWLFKSYVRGLVAGLFRF